MRYLLAAILAIGMVGCNGKKATIDVKEVVVVDPVVKETVELMAPMSEDHKVEVRDKAVSISKHDERVAACATWAKTWGFAIFIIGLLLVLPTVAGWFKFTIPGIGWGVAGLTAVVAFCSKLFGSKASAFAGSAVPRWGMWTMLGGAVIFASSYYMDFLFTFTKWSLIGLGIAAGLVIAWELACFYYTKKIDIPGDGVKPMPKG